MQNFLDLSEIESDDLISIINLAKNLKQKHKNNELFQPLLGKQLAMIFEKPSTRTRASFEVGINHLGGNAIILNSESSQLGRGESISDTANVISRYTDIIMIRCFKHETLKELAKNSKVPVINGLTDFSHPCQVMADVLTYEEHKGDIAKAKIAWVGDGNNMTTSWIHAAVKFGFELRIATPKQLKPDEDILNWAINNNGKVTWSNDPEIAVKGADLVTTDTWVSMGDADVEFRHKLLDPYRVNVSLMGKADSKAIFMHCLPAHRDEEVSTSVIDGPQSVIFDEAENRLHVQKAIMLWCLGKTKI